MQNLPIYRLIVSIDVQASSKEEACSRVYDEMSLVDKEDFQWESSDEAYDPDGDLIDPDTLQKARQAKFCSKMKGFKKMKERIKIQNHKDLRRGEILFELTHKENVSPYLDNDLQPCKDYDELSICCDLFHKNGGQASGQCYNSLLELFPNDEDIDKLVKIWKRWHLNGLRAGTRIQEEFIRNYSQNNPSWRYSYEAACALLRNNNLYEDRKCKYGHNWLVEKLPWSVVEEIGNIITKLKEKDL